MNPLIRLLAVLAIAVGGTYYGVTAYQKLKVESAERADLQRIEKDWLERANWVNAVPEADKYREERSSIDKWYFTELTNHYNRYPAFKNYFKVGDAISGKGKKAKPEGKKGDAALKQQYFGLTKTAFESLRDGSYNPLFTAQANSLRLDIVKVGRVSDEGKPRLRFDVILWGAQRILVHDKQTAGGTVSHMETAASFQALNFKLIDEKDKVFGEMNVTGDPEIKVDWPERWIEEFPPQAVIGYYEIDPLPAQPVKLELEVNVASRSANGNDIPGSFKFDLPIPSEWKLAPGETWEGATTEERPKEYIDQKSAN